MERKIETTPSELMKVLGGALLEQMHGEDPEMVEKLLTVITIVGLKSIRHLTGVLEINQEALDRYETDPADIEQYLQDQERMREKLRGEYLS